jgi:hypothetical protein
MTLGGPYQRARRPELNQTSPSTILPAPPPEQPETPDDTQATK